MDMQERLEYDWFQLFDQTADALGMSPLGFSYLPPKLAAEACSEVYGRQRPVSAMMEFFVRYPGEE